MSERKVYNFFNIVNEVANGKNIVTRRMKVLSQLLEKAYYNAKFTTYTPLKSQTWHESKYAQLIIAAFYAEGPWFISEQIKGRGQKEYNFDP